MQEPQGQAAEQPSTCPSAFALERYRLMDAAARPTELERHVSGCDRCAAYLSEAAQGEEGFARRAALRARVMSLAPEREEAAADDRAPWWEAARAWLLGHQGAVVGALAVAAAALLVVWWPGEGDGGHGLRVKNPTRPEVGLTVYADTRPDGVALVTGEEVRPGERLRFAVTLPEEGFVAILGVDSTGEVFVYYPVAEGAGLTRHAAGEPRLLEGAIALDDVLGEEWFIALSCRDAAPVQALKEAVASAAPGRAGWKAAGAPELMPGRCRQQVTWFTKVKAP